MPISVHAWTADLELGKTGEAGLADAAGLFKKIGYGSAQIAIPGLGLLPPSGVTAGLVLLVPRPNRSEFHGTRDTGQDGSGKVRGASLLSDEYR